MKFYPQDMLSRLSVNVFLNNLMQKMTGKWWERPLVTDCKAGDDQATESPWAQTVAICDTHAHPRLTFLPLKLLIFCKSIKVQHIWLYPNTDQMLLLDILYK